MASVGHVAVGIAVGRAVVPRDVSTWRLGLVMVGFATLSIAPDLDVLGFGRGVPYGHALGHRGLTHSWGVALLAGLAAWVLCRALDVSTRWALAVTVTLASHGLLDAMTDGGLGVALLWPISARRLFLPWRPLPVVPIGLRRLFALPRGRAALALELGYFVPLWVYALLPRRWLRADATARAPSNQSALSAQQRKPLAGSTTSSTACERSKVQERPSDGVW